MNTNCRSFVLSGAEKTKGRSNHVEHAPGYQWGYDTLQRVLTEECPKTEVNPKGDPNKCDHLVRGTLRVEVRCPPCNEACRELGVGCSLFEKCAFLCSPEPDQREFMGTSTEWARLIDNCRKDGIRSVQRRATSLYGREAGNEARDGVLNPLVWIRADRRRQKKAFEEQQGQNIRPFGPASSNRA